MIIADVGNHQVSAAHTALVEKIMQDISAEAVHDSNFMFDLLRQAFGPLSVLRPSAAAHKNHPLHRLILGPICMEAEIEAEQRYLIGLIIRKLAEELTRPQLKNFAEIENVRRASR